MLKKLGLPETLGIDTNETSNFTPKIFRISTQASPSGTSRTFKQKSNRIYTEPDFISSRAERNSKWILRGTKLKRFDNLLQVHSKERKNVRTKTGILQKNKIFYATHKSALRDYLSKGQIHEDVLYSDWLEFLLSKDDRFKKTHSKNKKIPKFLESEIARKILGLQKKLELELKYFNSYSQECAEDMSNMLTKYNKAFIGYLNDPCENQSENKTHYHDINSPKPLHANEIEKWKRTLKTRNTERHSFKASNLILPSHIHLASPEKNIKFKDNDLSSLSGLENPNENISNLNSLQKEIDNSKFQLKTSTKSLVKLERKMHSNFESNDDHEFMRDVRNGNFEAVKRKITNDKRLLNLKDSVKMNNYIAWIDIPSLDCQKRIFQINFISV